MLLVVCDHKSIPDWLYPDSRGQDRPEGEFTTAPRLDAADFSALWAVLDPEGAEPEALIWQSSHCDVGYPHDAPDYVDQIHPKLVRALADIADHERWQAAKSWASSRLAKRFNQEELASHKKVLKRLCSFAKLAVASERMIVLFEPDEDVDRTPAFLRSLI